MYAPQWWKETKGVVELSLETFDRQLCHRKGAEVKKYRWKRGEWSTPSVDISREWYGFEWVVQKLRFLYYRRGGPDGRRYL